MNEIKLWNKEINCPFCKSKFSVKRPFSNDIRISSYDEDMKPNYSGVNPIFYNIVFCPKCFFAFYINDENMKIKMAEEKKLEEVLSGLRKMGLKAIDNDIRSFESAIKIYAMSIKTYESMENYYKVATSYLNIGWLFRDKKMEKKEMAALAFALKNFEKAYNNTSNEQQEIVELFYLGCLNKMFGERKKAGEWFSLLMKNYRSSSSRYVKAASDIWQSMRGQ